VPSSPLIDRNSPNGAQGFWDMMPLKWMEIRQENSRPYFEISAACRGEMTRVVNGG